MNQPDGNNQEMRQDPDLVLTNDLVETIESAVGDTLSGALTENVRSQAMHACEELARMLADNGLDRQARIADKLKAALGSIESANAVEPARLSELIFQLSQSVTEPPEEETLQDLSFTETDDKAPKQEREPRTLPEINSLPVIDYSPEPAPRSARPDLVVYALTGDAAFLSRVRSVAGPDTEALALRSQNVAAKALTEDENALLIVDIGDSPDQSGPFNARLVSGCLDRVIVVGSNFTPWEIQALKKIGVRAVVEKSSSSPGLTRDEPDHEMHIGA